MHSTFSFFFFFTDFLTFTLTSFPKQVYLVWQDEHWAILPLIVRPLSSGRRRGNIGRNICLLVHICHCRHHCLVSWRWQLLQPLPPYLSHDWATKGLREIFLNIQNLVHLLRTWYCFIRIMMAVWCICDVCHGCIKCIHVYLLLWRPLLS